MRYRNIILIICSIIIILGVITVQSKTRKGHVKDTFQTDHKNILDTALNACSGPGEKTTGYFRNGYCSTGPTDTGTHVVCARMDDTFLNFTKSKGNDLITPQNSFPGLVSGDKWCLCALRWKEAHEAGKAPKIFAEATNEVATRYIEKNILMNYAS
jgi:uncharacterized protein (DUF2237 family)